MRFRKFIIVVYFISLFCGSFFRAYADAVPEYVLTSPSDKMYIEPFDVATDSNGNIFVVSRITSQVIKFNSDWELIRVIGSDGSANDQFHFPLAIAIDSDDNIYVGDSSNKRVVVLDNDGNYIRKFGTSGTGDGQFLSVGGLVVDDSGNVYTTDTSRFKMQKFDSDGNFVCKRQSFGSGNGQFIAPWGITMDSLGYVHVIDANNSNVQKFDSSCTYVSQFGSFGSGDGQFNQPRDVFIDSEDNIYVSDLTNHRIQKFTIGGTFITKWGSEGNYPHVQNNEFGTIYGGAVDSDNNVYIADIYGTVKKYSNTGTYLSRASKSVVGNEDQQLYNIEGIASDSEGYLYVTDGAFNRIKKLDKNGNFITNWGSEGSGEGEFDYPDAITIDSEDNIYVLDTGNYRVQKFTLEGEFITEFGSFGTGNGEFDYAEGLGHDSENNIYVVDSTNNRVIKFSSEGSFIENIGSSGTGDLEFDYPNGITFDEDDNGYVTDSGNDRVQKFDTDGNFVSEFGTSGTGDGQFSFVEAIFTDETQSLYVIDSGQRRIQKFDTDGSFILDFGTMGYDINSDEFIYPSGGVAGACHELYITDSSLSHFKKFIRTDTEYFCSSDSETNGLEIAEFGGDEGNDDGDIKVFTADEHFPSIKINTVDESEFDVAVSSYEVKIQYTDADGNPDGGYTSWISNINPDAPTGTDSRTVDGITFTFQDGSIKITTTEENYKLNDGTYYFKVRAYDSTGDYIDSNEVILIIENADDFVPSTTTDSVSPISAAIDLYSTIVGTTEPTSNNTTTQEPLIVVSNLDNKEDTKRPENSIKSVLGTVTEKLASTANNNSANAGVSLLILSTLFASVLFEGIKNISVLTNPPNLKSVNGAKLYAFGFLLKHRNPWGVVYDSKTKMPLDPAIVELTSTDGKVYRAITDMYGRYDFIVPPGKYKLAVSKTDFQYPSTTIINKWDETVYSDVLLDSSIEVNEKQAIRFNIPMDPLNPNWNQEEKARMGYKAPSVVLTPLSKVGFALGVIWSTYSLFVNHGILNIALVSIFAALTLYRISISNYYKWGVIKNKYGTPADGAIVSLVNAKFPQLSPRTVVADTQGRYNFLVGPSAYKLQIDLLQQGNKKRVYESDKIVITKKFDTIARHIKLS